MSNSDYSKASSKEQTNFRSLLQQQQWTVIPQDAYLLTFLLHGVVTGVKSLSRLTSVPFLTNMGAIVEYRQKKLQTYLQVSIQN